MMTLHRQDPPMCWILRCASLLFLAIPGLLHAQLQNATPQVAGSVVDDAGKPVAAARVLISHSILSAGSPHFTAPPTVTGPLAATTVSDGTGNFTAINLAPGQYVACAQTTTQGGLLDPCHWAASAPSFDVVAGKVTPNVDVVMPRGVALPVHLNDPQGLLKQVTGPVDFDLEIHLVTSKGLHYSMPIQAQGPQGRDFGIAIPFDTALSIRVLSAHFAVSDDATGNPVAQAGISALVPSGAAAQQFSFTVTGEK